MMRLGKYNWFWGALVLAVSGSVSAADWGDLTAKFILDGPAPAPKPLTITKEPEICGKFGLTSEKLIVNSANNGIANVIVFPYVPRGAKPPAIHDSYKETEKEAIRLDNEKCRFAPHVVALRTTQTLIVGNKDPTGHNTNIATLTNPGQNILIPANGNLKLSFPAAESLPSTVSCNIHPWMQGFVVVKDHPYIGISDADGKMTIKNLPVGKMTLQVWQEAAGYVARGKQNGKPFTWMRGRVEVTIKAGPNDLGEIKLDPAIFKL